MKLGKMPSGHWHLVLTMSAYFINKMIRNLILQFILEGAAVDQIINLDHHVYLLTPHNSVLIRQSP